MDYVLSFCTPTYNGCAVINRVYESLKLQTNKNFKWIIIDDGSSDNTKDVLNNFINEKSIFCEYIYQENGGKYKAMMNAIHHCDTELICFVDDDVILDSLVADTIISAWIENTDKNFVGIGMPLSTVTKENEEVVKKFFPFSSQKTGKIAELTSKYGYHGETVYAFKTEDLKRIQLPDFGNEKFLTESAIFFPLCKEKNVLWLNQFAGVGMYLENGLTSKRKQYELRSPNATLFTYKMGAIFHPVYLHRIANACLYLSWKRIVPSKDLCNQHISPIVLLPAYIMEPIYCRNFKKGLKSLLNK